MTAATTGPVRSYRDLSFWHASLPGPDPLLPRAPLPGHTSADVAIVGGGFTGLWTAYYLLEAQPDLRIVLLEREVAGFGASGRNGGWCSALFPASWEAVARRSSRSAAVALQRAMNATVDEVGRVLAAERIDAHYAKGGTVSLARSPVQLHRARERVATAREWGFGEEDLRLLDAGEAAELIGADGVLGGVRTPHCAAVHPARLVRGLAAAVERRGAVLHEQTEVQTIAAGEVRTSRGRVRAPFVVRATEAFTPGLPGLSRALVPVYSLMVATEQLPDELWQQIGLHSRPTFNELRNTIVYGQRTADGRIAFGGRGAPYRAGSRISPRFDRDERVFAWLRDTLREMFPALRSARFPFAWGGAVAFARDAWASCGLHRRSGLAWAGGYVGDGVGTSNLAGRTLADLLLERDTDLVRLPWVGHQSPEWEPEPLRWLGINAAIRATDLADAEEARTGRPSGLGRVVARLTRP